MKNGTIKDFVGANRIARNGDVANKIGTYSHSFLQRSMEYLFLWQRLSLHWIDTPTGDDIVIEERSVDEVAYIGNVQIAPEGIKIKNPSFDVTPAKNITAIITERGVIEKPEGKGIMELF